VKTVVIALLLATSWILATSAGAGQDPSRAYPLWLLVLGSCLVIWRTRLHLLWVLGLGAILGALGIV
jgi:chromate transporter